MIFKKFQKIVTFFKQISKNRTIFSKIFKKIQIFGNFVQSSGPAGRPTSLRLLGYGRGIVLAPSRHLRLCFLLAALPGHVGPEPAALRHRSRGCCFRSPAVTASATGGRGRVRVCSPRRTRTRGLRSATHYVEDKMVKQGQGQCWSVCAGDGDKYPL